MEPHTQKANTLLGLKEYGQSVWLDYLRRGLIESGDLQRMIEEDGLCGMTSNPSIFEKSIDETDDYKEALQNMNLRKGMDAKTVYESLAVEDIQLAADALFQVYEETDGKDGYISMEVSPFLAHDTQGTMQEVRRLWKSIDRPNVMIKVPATVEGIPAIEQLTAEGFSINITLIFSQEVYEQVAQAYIKGIGKFAAQGGNVRQVASVASFFVSRIDTDIDALIEERLSKTKDPKEIEGLRNILGKVAIANAKLAYVRYKELFSSPQWHILEEQGARPQRLLWASTGTKNPQYSDVLYIEELIGQDTVNTMPPKTMEGFKDHGHLRKSLTENIDEASHTMETLSTFGISLNEVTDKLLFKAVDLFSKPFKNLLGKLQEKINKGE